MDAEQAVAVIGARPRSGQKRSRVESPSVPAVHDLSLSPLKLHGFADDDGEYMYWSECTRV